MYLSKTIADHIRENIDRNSTTFKMLYVLAVIVRIVELLAIISIVWFFAVVILSI